MTTTEQPIVTTTAWLYTSTAILLNSSLCTLYWCTGRCCFAGSGCCTNQHTNCLAALTHDVMYLVPGNAAQYLLLAGRCLLWTCVYAHKLSLTAVAKHCLVCQLVRYQHMDGVGHGCGSCPCCVGCWVTPAVGLPMLHFCCNPWYFLLQSVVLKMQQQGLLGRVDVTILFPNGHGIGVCVAAVCWSAV